MISKEEAKKIYDVCSHWPGGLGCVLVPAKNTKRGFKTADWGWRGKRVGDFDYSHLSQFDHPLFCPVTAIGIMRGAKSFQDHMIAYRDINQTLCQIINREYEDVKRIYNFLLSHYPLSLSCIFYDYANDIQFQSCPLDRMKGGYYGEMTTTTKRGQITIPVAILLSDTNTIWTVDDIAFTKSGQSSIGTLKEWR